MRVAVIMCAAGRRRRSGSVRAHVILHVLVGGEQQVSDGANEEPLKSRQRAIRARGQRAQHTWLEKREIR